jgi:hypothetical protein
MPGSSNPYVDRWFVHLFGNQTDSGNNIDPVRFHLRRGDRNQFDKSNLHGERGWPRWAHPEGGDGDEDPDLVREYAFLVREYELDLSFHTEEISEGITRLAALGDSALETLLGVSDVRAPGPAVGPLVAPEER